MTIVMMIMMVMEERIYYVLGTIPSSCINSFSLHNSTMAWVCNYSCLIYIIFNRRIIALHYGISFCRTRTWISYKHTYMPSLLNLCSCPTPSQSSRLSQTPGWVPCCPCSSFPLVSSNILHMVVYIYFNANLSIYSTVSMPCYVQSLFSLPMFLFLPCK